MIGDTPSSQEAVGEVLVNLLHLENELEPGCLEPEVEDLASSNSEFEVALTPEDMAQLPVLLAVVLSLEEVDCLVGMWEKAPVPRLDSGH